jgi:hypothetical protein
VEATLFVGLRSAKAERNRRRDLGLVGGHIASKGERASS